MIKAVIFDIDGTLFDHSIKGIPVSSIISITKLREKGILVFIATGRNMNNERNDWIIETIKPDGIVHMNGQMVQAKEETIFVQYFDLETKKRLLEFAKENEITLGIFDNNCIYYVNFDLFIARNPKNEWENLDKMILGDYKELYNMDICQFILQGPAEDAKKIEDNFEGIKAVPFFNNKGADVFFSNVSKATGTEKLLKYYNLNWENVMFFGDSKNDIEIIKEAKIGIAMGNSVPELFEYADEITDAIQDNGIYNSLLKHKLIKE